MSDTEKDVPIVPIRNWEKHTLRCPKCDADDEMIEMVWRTGGMGLVNEVEYALPDGFEYLACKCKRCAFEWLMQTADADERAKEAELMKEENEKEEEEDIPALDTTGKAGHGGRIAGRRPGGY